MSSAVELEAVAEVPVSEFPLPTHTLLTQSVNMHFVCFISAVNLCNNKFEERNVPLKTGVLRGAAAAVRREELPDAEVLPPAVSTGAAPNISGGRTHERKLPVGGFCIHMVNCECE